MNVIDCVDLIVSESDLNEFERLCDQWEKEQYIYNDTAYLKHNKSIEFYWKNGVLLPVEQ